MADPADTPTNPAAVVEQVDKTFAEKFRRGMGGSYDRDVERLAYEAARHRLLGIEQGRAEMREEAAAFLDGYAGGHYMAKSCAQAIRAIPTAKDRPDAG